ncbi:MAG: ribonuclease H-like domain-containing protein [Planctomycetes bacterium]|nr:ribonuclease H-like domain-containing protein [Planctomycetota bacterium]
MPPRENIRTPDIIATLLSKGGLTLASRLPADRDSGDEGRFDFTAKKSGSPTTSSFAGMCPGRQVRLKLPRRKTGLCWLIRRPLAKASPADVPNERHFSLVMRGARQRFDELAASAELCQIASCEPGDILFLDIETCGLRDCELFLIGLMFFRGGRLIFEQYFARDYEEETAVIAAAVRRLRQARILVTFNGKAFDMKFIAGRACRYGFDSLTCPPHLDLLRESRRRWRGQVPNFRLGTLEKFLLGRFRKNDIPSREIPAAYHEFIRTGRPGLMPAVLYHNMLDLLSMAQLLCMLLTGEEPAND